MRYPMAFITIPIVLGIIFSYYIEMNLPHILFLLILSVLINIICIIFNYSNKTGLFISLFLLGIFITNLKANSSQLMKFVDRNVELEGSIVEVKDAIENKNRYVVSVHNIRYENMDTRVSERILLNAYGNDRLNLGDKIKFNAVLREPMANTNPKLYNYRLNLAANNIFTTATIMEYSIIDVTKPKLNVLLNLKIDFINKVEEIFDTFLTEENSSIMKSVVLGKYSYLEEEDINKFRNLGITHILSVSGLHIAVITGLLVGSFAFLRINKKVSIILTIVIIWFYAYIIGYPVSALRANIMFTVLLISQLISRPYDSLNSLFFSQLIIVLINPYWIFDIGFQLSFMATFSIIYFMPKINRFLFSGGSNIIKSLSTIIAVQLGLLPILAYYFNRVPIIGIVANLLLIPLFNICLILSMILIPFSFISHYIASSIGSIIDFILNIQFIGTELLNHFPVLNIRLPSPSIGEIIIYYILLFVLLGIFDIRKIPREISKIIVVYLIFLIAINFIYISFDKTISIEFIDVGQGDSILVKTKKGNYLIDTGGNSFGSFDIGKNILLPYLEKNGIFKLKGVFISHFHEDHSKSLPYLIDNMDIENIYIGYTDDDNSLYNDIKYKSYEKGIPINVLKKGDMLKLDNNTQVFVIGPSDKLLRTNNDEENEISMVLLMKYFQNRLLFAGDIESKGEANVIQTLNTYIDFIKVPHHGSSTSSGEEFINKLNPKIAIISVGRNNIFGHPDKEVIERYRNNNVNIYRTDECGLIKLILDRDDYKIETYIRGKNNIFNIIESYGQCIVFLIAYYIVIYMLLNYYVALKKEVDRIEFKGIY